MATLIGGLNAAVGLFLGDKKSLSIDNWTFKLFYQWSVTLVTGCSILVSSNQLFGDPIQCDLTGDEVSEKVLKSYCWMYSTFNIPREFTGQCARKSQSDNPVYNSYYQWVSLFLIFQAFLFYCPRIIWLMSEGGLMKYLGKGTTGKIIEEEDEKMTRLLKTFKDHLQNKYNRYVAIFFMCEVLNLMIVISQFFITNVFLENQFLFYGPKVWQYYSYPPEEIKILDLHNPMCEAFPRVASCTFRKFGSGGRVSRYSALCILSLNIVIDKIYLVLWYWYMLITVLGLIRVVCRIFQIFSSKIRFWLMKIKMHRYFKRSKNLDSLEIYIRAIKIGDWFVLYQMSKNLNRRFFYDFLLALAKEYEVNPDAIETPFIIDMPDHAGDDGPPPLMQDSPRSLKKEIPAIVNSKID